MCEMAIFLMFVIASVRTYKIMPENIWVYFILLFGLMTFAFMILLPFIVGFDCVGTAESALPIIETKEVKQ